jgi:hypothetical protein
MITYGLVKQVGPYSKNEPSSYNFETQNRVVMSPRYPYDPSGESTSIHNRSLWAARLVSDAGNLEDPKTSLQYVKAKQKKENLTIVLGNLFGNTFAVAPPTEPQQPQGRTLGRPPMATALFLAGLQALNYELRRQRETLSDVNRGAPSPALSEYSGPGIESVTPRPFAEYPFKEDVPTPPPAPSPIPVTANGTPDSEYAKQVLSAGLQMMDQTLADSVADEVIREELKSDNAKVWNAFSEISSAELEYEVARMRFENLANEIQSTVSDTRQIQQSVMVAQSPVSNLAPKTSMLNQSLQTAGIPPEPVSASTTPVSPSIRAFDLLLKRWKSLYKTMEEVSFKELYEKKIQPNLYTKERVWEENKLAQQKIQELQSIGVPESDPTVEGLKREMGQLLGDLEELKTQSNQEAKTRKAMETVQNVIQKYGVWTPDQPIQFLNPGVWNPSQPIQYVDTRKKPTSSSSSSSRRRSSKSSSDTSMGPPSANNSPTGLSPIMAEMSVRDRKRYLNAPPPINTNVGRSSNKSSSGKTGEPMIPDTERPKRAMPFKAVQAPKRRARPVPPPINTNVRRVANPQVRRRNIGRAMDSFIPQRRQPPR